MLKIYNTLTKKKEVFKPIKNGKVGIYSCGPTVYDFAHIGNLRAYIFTDILQKVLCNLEGLDISWVMNITDIDDKLIDRLKSIPGDGGAEDKLKQITQKYTQAFLGDLQKLNINPADISSLPKATEYIAKMQALITELLEKGIAYTSKGSVYFSVEKYKEAGHKYGVLSNLDYLPQARVTDDQDQKEGVADFALWKQKHEGEPFWDFNIKGKNFPGRPGWHIECSVMSSDKLGKIFDIHTGGVDHIFPHHENEIAQSGGELANYFVHNEFLLVDGRKMSKSLNNFYKLADIPEPLAFRYLCLSTHYRSQLNYTQTSYEAAQKRLKNIRNFVSKLTYNVTNQPSKLAQDFKAKFSSALEDDLNTPDALAALAELESDTSLSEDTLKAIAWADKILSLSLETKKQEFNTKEKDLIEQRQKSRQKKDFTKSDEIRIELYKLGIIVEDGRDNSQLAWREV